MPCGVLGFFEQVGSTAEKEFHRVANALSYEYRFAHSYSRHIYEKYTYRKYVLFIWPIDHSCWILLYVSLSSIFVQL